MATTKARQQPQQRRSADVLGVIGREHTVGSFPQRDQDVIARLEIDIPGKHLAFAVVDLHQDAGVLPFQDFHARDLVTLHGAAQVDLALFDDLVHLRAYGLRAKGGHLRHRQLHLREVGQEQESGDNN